MLEVVSVKQCARIHEDLKELIKLELSCLEPGKGLSGLEHSARWYCVDMRTCVQILGTHITTTVEQAQA